MEKRIAIMRTSCIHATAEGKCNYTDGLDMKCHGDTCSAYEREIYSAKYCITKSLKHPTWNTEWEQYNSPEPVYILNGHWINNITQWKFNQIRPEGCAALEQLWIEDLAVIMCPHCSANYCCPDYQRYHDHEFATTFELEELVF